MTTGAAPRALSPVARLELARLADHFTRWAPRCFTIQDKRDRLVPFRLRPMQLAIYRKERELLERDGRARYMVLKGRQGGVTTLEQALALHLVWHRPGAKALTLSHEATTTDRIFLVTQTAVDHFPKELLHPLGAKATREISFPGLRSVFWTGTAGALRTGRGLTLKRLHGSEFCFWTQPRKMLAAVSPSLERPGTVIALESTASGYGSDSHEFWQEAVAGRNGYTALFYPWWLCDPELYRDPLEAPDALGTLEPEEAELVERHGLDLEQIAWRRRVMAEYGRDLFLQEYAEDAESCWLAVGGLFYEAGDLKRLAALAPEPVRTERNGAVTWYVTEEELRALLEAGERVVGGSDTAEGVGNDRSTAVFRTVRGRLLMAYEDRGVDPLELAALLNAWGRLLATRGRPAFLVVEKNLHGITTLRQLRDVHSYPAASIYHRTVADTERDEKVDRIGWHTSAESKPLLLDGGRELIAAILRGAVDPMPAAAVRDAFGVRRDETGKVNTNGKDVLVAELLAWQGRDAAPGLKVLPPVHW